MAAAENTTTGTGTPEVSGGVVDTLGLKPDVFIAQLVNFLVILFVLWRFAYKPLLKILEDRSAKIEKGLADAERAAAHLSEIEAEHKAAMAETRAEAAAIIKEAHAKGDAKRDEMLASSREEIARLVADARKKIAEERTGAAEELKKEISALVVATVSEVLGEKIDAKKDASLMERAIKKASRE
ncbi:MAG: F0F1 ATP synthase subunit B [Candidatus Magasanikbacteria bacterium]|nr:F0F1 ATP synthase subunit B [Candidatus Magasanikbacteria bacterium]